ncbi:MAG: hypothetical protein AB7G38_14565 [Dehalococcoidia bacterium]
MTTATDADLVYARYNGSPMRTLPAFGDTAKHVPPGSILLVTADIKPAMLRRLNGSDAERSWFTPVEAEYVRGLEMRCATHGLVFDDEITMRRHQSACESALNQRGLGAAVTSLSKLIDEKQAEIKALEDELEELRDRHFKAMSDLDASELFCKDEHGEALA